MALHISTSQICAPKLLAPTRAPRWVFTAQAAARPLDNGRREVLLTGERGLAVLIDSMVLVNIERGWNSLKQFSLHTEATI